MLPTVEELRNIIEASDKVFFGLRIESFIPEIGSTAGVSHYCD